MSEEFLITIDQGTTGSRIFLFNKRAQVISSAYEEFTQHFPYPGWVEHDANEIWNSIERLLDKALQSGNVNPKKAISIGVTNQRETTVVWHKKTGQPIHNAIVWQCRRTADFCQKLKESGKEPLVHSKTGLVLDAYFSATKIRWLLDNVNGAREQAKKGELMFGTIDTFLLHRLTNGGSHKTDHTNASRTMLYDIHKKQWDTELSRLFDVPMSILPEVQNSASLFGKTRALKSLPDGIPIHSMVGDQQSALFGQLCFRKGDIKNTYGTGCFMLMNTGNQYFESKSGLVSTIACDEQGAPAYALEGSVFIGGAVMQFLRDSFHFFKDVSETEEAALSVSDDDEIVFVPAFAGLGAPHWDQDAQGAIFGLTRGTSMQQIVRSALKAIALQSKELFDAMQKDVNMKVAILKVDGGATKNKYLMKYQASILGVPVVLPRNIETTVLGAAYLAGLSSGFWGSLEDLEKLNPPSEKFAPDMFTEKEIKKELRLWDRALRRVRLH